MNMPPTPWQKRCLDAFDLVSGFAADLADGLLHRETCRTCPCECRTDLRHWCSSAAYRLERCLPSSTKRARLAPSDEAQVLQSVERQMHESVVDLDVVDVVVGTRPPPRRPLRWRS